MAISVAHFAPPPDWPKMRDVARVAAEARDVVAHPAQREHEVEHAGVAGVGELGPAESAQIQVPERVQAVVDGDDDDVAAARQPRAVGLECDCWCRWRTRRDGTRPAPAAAPPSASAGVHTLR